MENEIQFNDENKNESNSQNPTPIINQENIGEAHNPALHLFLYLVSFFSLASFSFGIGAILFQFINKHFPDAVLLDYSNYFAQPAVKFGIASIIIAMPLYFTLMYFIVKYLYEGKIKENSGIRKWLTYIILFFTSAIIIGDLITSVFRMLDGDMMTRFILKVLVVFLIAGLIFVYYIVEMKKRDMVGMKYLMNKIFLFFGIIISCVVFVLGFTIIDSPFVSRDKKIDQKIVSDIKSYDRQVVNYYNEKGVLPENLENLKSESSYYGREINKAIIYRKISLTEYKLCANFKRASSEYKEERNRNYLYDGFSDNNEGWKFEKGDYCFEKNVKNTKINYNAQNINNSVNAEEARKKAKIASIRSEMNSMLVRGTLCRDAGGEIVPGRGESALCSMKNGEKKSDLTWGKIPSCGLNNENTNWTVKDGSLDSWEFYLTCNNAPYCDGSTNATCNAKGCDFKGGCAF